MGSKKEKQVKEKEVTPSHARRNEIIITIVVLIVAVVLGIITGKYLYELVYGPL